MYGSYQSQLSDLTSELQYQSAAMVTEIEEKNYMINMSQPVLSAQIEQLAQFYRGRIILVGDDFIIREDTYSMSEGKYDISESVILCFDGTSDSRYDRDEVLLELTLPISGDDGTVAGAFVITASAEPIINRHQQLQEGFFAVAVIAAIIVVALSLYFSSRFVRPLRKVVRAIDNSSQESVGEDIQVDDCSETSQISSAYNRMLARVRTLDDSRQQFVSDVSHELKTPITSIRVLADSLMSTDDAPVELYQEFMTDISSEIDRESRIIDDLLTLVRMDRSNSELNIAETNLNDMLEGIMKRLRPLALNGNVDLVLESFRPVVADVDEVKLDLAVTNLIENAIKYNVDNGWVRVSLNADHQYFYIKVADSGIGIAQEEWDHIFERFYRVDKTRSRSTGGTGLGLSITRNIVLMHHGEIRVHSVVGEGTTFTVRIPRTYQSGEDE